jgi:hypothetical protein
MSFRRQHEESKSAFRIALALPGANLWAFKLLLAWSQAILPGRDEQLALTSTCLMVQIGNRRYYHLLNNIQIFFILAVNYHLSFVHLMVSVISKFWIYRMKRSLISNYRCRNYHFAIHFYQILDFKQAQTVILPFNNQILNF